MATAEKQDIRKLSLEEITTWFTKAGEKSFRAKQVYEWLWKKGAASFEEMTNLSKDLRWYLEDQFVINAVTEDLMQQSSDGTIKLRLKLHDGELIEGVIIPTATRTTACVSSQVGCSLSCKFCATGFMDRKRNLDPSEIFDQVIIMNQKALENYGNTLTNIVFMGMGEPLLNYKNVMAGIERITSPEGLNISSKRITVSTAGVVKMIVKLADDEVKFNLALSLHAANDAKRNKIMAINETNNLEALVEALIYFDEKTGNEITFEYILFDGFNDSLQDAKELTELCKKVPAKVNLIEYNKVDNVPYKKATSANRDAFVNYLEKNKIIAVVRRSRGKDIDAACGQLANKA